MDDISSIVQKKLSSYANDLEVYARFYSAPRYRTGSTEELVTAMSGIAKEMKRIQDLREPKDIRKGIRQITSRIDSLLARSPSTKQ